MRGLDLILYWIFSTDATFCTAQKRDRHKASIGFDSTSTDEVRVMKIFVSYRREDNAQRAMNMAAILRVNFGKGNVFLDVEDIEIGSLDGFPEIILKELKQSQLVLALISPEWLSALDVDYRRRIDSDKDWVQIELRTALKFGLPVIPVYVGGAEPLKESQLPEPLRKLATLQYYELRDNNHHWKDDVAALISHIKVAKLTLAK
jgi:hypothetical protein